MGFFFLNFDFFVRKLNLENNNIGDLVKSDFSANSINLPPLLWWVGSVLWSICRRLGLALLSGGVVFQVFWHHGQERLLSSEDITKFVEFVFEVILTTDGETHFTFEFSCQL